MIRSYSTPADNVECSWICPNDRHLALRAKLRAGWSVRSNKQVRKDEDGLTEVELKKIKNVILKSTMLEEMEQDRIGCLVHRLNIMRQNSMGNGKSTCILCAEPFGKFVRSTPIICVDCKTKVCNKCCVDYGTGVRPTQTKSQNQQIIAANWLCKICSENRELWKRSGAWFFQALPSYRLPEESPIELHRSQRPINGMDSPQVNRKATNLTIPDSPATGRGHNRSLSGSSVGSFQWAKPIKPHFTSSSDGEESSDDDGITLGKGNRVNVQLRSDTSSLTSSTSASTGQHTLSTPSPGVRRRGSRRTTFRSGGSRSGSIRGKKNLPRVHVTEDYDTTSMDSGSTEFSHDGNKLENEMATLHGGSMGSPMSLRSDYSGLSERENRGVLEFSVLYDPLKSALHVHIIRGKNLQAKDANGFSDPYVKLHLLPGVSRATKLRTKTKSRTLDPLFDESLTYWGIGESELPTRQLLVTVLDEDRFSHNDFIGEVIVPLEGIVPTQKKMISLPLQPMYALSEKDKTPRDPGRILLGLRYHTVEHCLAVTVSRCANLVPKNYHDNVNAFVKLSLSLDDNQTITHRTGVKKKTQNPMFNTELKFKVSSENGHAEVARGMMQVVVLNKDAIGQEVIGSLRLGINSDGEKLKHWFNCLKNKDQQFDSWHTLSFESPRKSKGKQ